jgi:hypothetical protein
VVRPAIATPIVSAKIKPEYSWFAHLQLNGKEDAVKYICHMS